MKLVMNEISQECKQIHTKTRTGNSAERWTKAVFPLATILWHRGHGAEIRTGRNLGVIAVPASSLDLCQVKKWPMVNYRKKSCNSFFYSLLGSRNVVVNTTDKNLHIHTLESYLGPLCCYSNSG